MTESWIREPCFARTFYPHQPAALGREIERCLGTRRAEEPARVLVAPHAGYVYSGAVAGALYARARIEARVVLLAPNHTGHGERLSVWAHGSWRLPTGEIPVAEDLAARLVQAHPDLAPDRRAHEQEHAIEVQLPFLLHRRSDVAIVPMVLGPLELDRCQALGKAIGRVIAEETLPVQLLASTDMSHYVPAGTAKTQDMKAIDRIVALDPEGLYETVKREDITMCGFIPTTVALFAAKALGCAHAELCRYGNSGDTTEDYDSVVGYASLLVR